MSNYKMLINGELVEAESGKTIPVINPATGGQFATIPMGGEKDIDKAVAAAKKAFPAWSHKSAMERSMALSRIGQGLQARTEELAQLDCRNHGSPITVTRNRARGAAFGLSRGGGQIPRNESVELFEE